jgi:hypothetical protein
MTGFYGPKKVVISSKKYDIHKLALNLDTLKICILLIFDFWVAFQNISHLLDPSQIRYIL